MQPWAALVAIGAKRIETRSWKTSYRGPLAIHAAKGYPRWARETCDEGPFRKALGILEPGGLLRGYVLAATELLDCLPVESMEPWAGKLPPGVATNILIGPELSFGDFSPGRFAWILGRPTLLSEPIPARGALGLWEWKEAA